MSTAENVFAVAKTETVATGLHTDASWLMDTANARPFNLFLEEAEDRVGSCEADGRNPPMGKGALWGMLHAGGAETTGESVLHLSGSCHRFSTNRLSPAVHIDSSGWAKGCPDMSDLPGKDVSTGIATKSTIAWPPENNLSRVAATVLPGSHPALWAFGTRPGMEVGAQKALPEPGLTGEADAFPVSVRAWAGKDLQLAQPGHDHLGEPESKLGISNRLAQRAEVWMEVLDGSSVPKETAAYIKVPFGFARSIYENGSSDLSDRIGNGRLVAKSSEPLTSIVEQVAALDENASATVGRHLDERPENPTVLSAKTLEEVNATLGKTEDGFSCWSKCSLSDVSLQEIRGRIILAARSLARGEAHKAKIELMPAHLGKLELEVDLGSALTIRLMAHNEDAFQAIRQNLQFLRDSLHSQGFILNDIHLSMESDGHRDENGPRHEGNAAPGAEGGKGRGTLGRVSIHDGILDIEA